MATKKTFTRDQKELVNVIKAKMVFAGFNLTDLSVRSGVSRATLYDHFRHPDKFRFAELQAIAASLGTGVKDLVERI